MPSADLSGFGKAMFEKRMRERNMGQDSFGQFRMPPEPSLNEVQRDRLQEIMETTRTDSPAGEVFKRFTTSGFDNSALMQDPKFKQEDTMNQGMAVSEPYEEANEKAFEKNNPMNAISQETPVGDRVSDFLSKFNQTEFEPVAKQQEAKRKYDFPAIYIPRGRR